MIDRFEVGQIAGTHGIKGDVKVFPTTDFPERFKVLKSAYLVGGRGEIRKVSVSNVRYSGRFVIVHLSGFETPEEARLLHGFSLQVDRKDAVPLEEGRYYIPDLIGIRVEDEEGKVLGTFQDVIRTGANDVYTVEKPGGGILMIPAIPECILKVSLEEGYMKVHLLPGLEDL